MNLYEIKELAEKSTRAVFSVQQLSNLIGTSKANAKVYMERLVKKKLAKRVQRGKISFSFDDFVISTQIIEPSYVSLRSALLFHNLIQQIPKNIECVTTKNSISIDGIKYHKINEKLFFGFKKIKKANSYFFIAEPEKAFIDLVYLNMLSTQDILEIKEKLNHSILEKFINKYHGKGSKKLRELL
ncbi:hypothetical protein JXA56_02115 [Candidatus Micrarchaeota archaeon]|nr:hypothetical protein [Candidatus Micrarchaeota archaeon]